MPHYLVQSGDFDEVVEADDESQAVLKLVKMADDETDLRLRLGTLIGVIEVVPGANYRFADTYWARLEFRKIRKAERHEHRDHL